jgi:hypothetical protein
MNSTKAMKSMLPLNTLPIKAMSSRILTKMDYLFPLVQ